MSKALSRWKTLGFCLVAVLCLTIVQEPVLGETFYVAPDGDDNNPGTIAEPLATLVGARNRVRKVLDGSGDITVYLRGGTYHLSKTVVFGLEDSGSENQKIQRLRYRCDYRPCAGFFEEPTKGQTILSAVSSQSASRYVGVR